MSNIETRELLIREGHKALVAGGYDGTGIGPVLKAAGVPKGSFYHFFESKDAFACAVLESYVEHYRHDRRRILENESLPPLKRLQHYFESLIEIVEEEDFCGCLFGNLSLSVSARSPVFRSGLLKAFEEWQDDLRRVLQEARDSGDLAPSLDPEETAAFLIDAYEGALIRARAEGDVRPLERFITMASTRLLTPHA